MPRNRNCLILAAALLLPLSAPVGGADEALSSEKLLASGGRAEDYFGSSAALDGERLLVGAPAGLGFFLDGAPGFAVLFELDPVAGWTEVTRLVGSGSADGDLFADAVALDGDVAVVGAPNDDAGGPGSGAAYVFELDAGTGAWVETARLVEPGYPLGFGTAVAVSGDTVAVGRPGNIDVWGGCGGVFVYRRDGAGGWQVAASIAPGDPLCADEFGVALDLDGDTLVAGARHLDDAWVHERDLGGPGAWGQAAKLVPSDDAGGGSQRFGQAVAVDGDTVVVGAPWDPEIDAVGAAYVFRRAPADPLAWRQVAKLTAPGGAEDDLFADSVAVDGDWLLAGATGRDDPADRAGEAFLFQRHRDGREAWGLYSRLRAFDAETQDLFGSAVAVIAGRAAVGAEGESELGDDAGAAYAFAFAGPSVTATGPCPGTVELEIAGATPDAAVAVVGAAEAGLTVIPGPPCAGTPLDLAAPRPVHVFAVGDDGTATGTIEAPAAVCGWSVQAVDAVACLAGEPATLPAPVDHASRPAAVEVVE